MQWRAKKINSTLTVTALRAERHTDYQCLECGETVRVRGGEYRQKHFYHLNPRKKCRQTQKSAQHLQTQLFIQNLIGEGAEMEVRFPTISRIADLYWEEKHYVFEVQCSPISAQEIDERNRDYESLGLKVIWIFHDKRFRKRRLSSAEKRVAEEVHYFTNINTKGYGCVYDQYAHYDRGILDHTLEILPVDLSTPKEKGFYGDRYNNGEEWKKYITNKQENRCWSWRDVVDYTKERYLMVFNYFLEQSCH
jgi:competence protein CoiA